MNDLWLTVYGDQFSALEDPAFLLNEFNARHNAAVRVSHMTFEEAWPKLLDFALHGGGPHVSLIGAVWTSTLSSMNVLRPFSSSEINSMGGASAFFPPAWNNAVASADSAASIPFNMFTYLVLYRKDHLARAGIHEATAFSSPQAMTETVRKLKAAGIASPLALPSGEPFRARTHLLASWIWGAGGGFISDDEKRTLFAEPEAVRGMVDFFDLYRLMSPADYGLTPARCLNRFARGETSVVISAANSQQAIQAVNHPDVLQNIGVAPVPGVPWFGGANLIIWKEVRMNLDQERAAIELAKYLTTPAAQVRLANANNSIPTRAAALSQLAYPIPAFQNAVERSVQAGRSYPQVRLWVRIMNELVNVFDAITAEVIEKPDDPVEQILQRRLKPLSNRLNMMLS